MEKDTHQIFRPKISIVKDAYKLIKENDVIKFTIPKGKTTTEKIENYTRSMSYDEFLTFLVFSSPKLIHSNFRNDIYTSIFE